MLARQAARTQVAAPVRAALRLAPRQVRSTRLFASSLGHFTSGYTLSTEDRLEIMDLCYKFDAALNRGEQARLGAFFAPDAELHTPKASLRGVQPILDYFASVKHMAQGNRHLTLDMLVEADGVRSARVTAYRLLHRAASPPQLLASGTIEDRVVNVNGEWKFASRTFTMDPPAAEAN